MNVTERMMIEVEKNRLELIDMASNYCEPSNMGNINAVYRTRDKVYQELGIKT